MTELTGIKTPEFDWNSSDLPTAFENFCQYVELVFTGPFAKKEATEKVTYLLLWMGQEAITTFNSWDETDLSEADKRITRNSSRDSRNTLSQRLTLELRDIFCANTSNEKMKVLTTS